MSLAAVLRYDLITTSRRGRYYAARVAYGLFLLFSLHEEYQRSVAYPRMGMWPGRVEALTTSEQTIRLMTRFAASALVAFAWSQWVTALVVVPALTAGVIADAHRRKTLRDLLSSGFSGRSIVLGKLGARLVHVGTFALLGLPVVALVGLFGGLDPWAVFYAYAGTASIALALGGASILASTLSRRPRDAIVLAYVLEGAWLFLPFLLRPIIPFLYWPFYLLVPVNDLLIASSPAPVWSIWSGVRDMSIYATAYGTAAAGGMLMRSDELHHAFLLMAGLQASAGVVCAALAAALLRPLRAGDGGVPWAAFRARFRRRPGHTPAPRPGWSRPSWVSVPMRAPCGDDPMWWKERYASARGGLAWGVGRPFVLFLGTLLGCYLYDVAWPSLRNVASFGYFGVRDIQREELSQAVRLTGTYLFVFWLLAAASAGAVGIISEREDDTWTSLTTTLLTGPEVVRAKVFGALWGTRRLALAVFSVIAVGVLGGGVHPLGGLAAVLGMAAFGGFAAALGVSISLRSGNSTRALVVTVLVLVLINSGSLLARAAFGAGPYTTAWAVTATPVLEWFSLLSYQDARVLWGGGAVWTGYPVLGPSAVTVLVAGLTGYGLSAVALTAHAGKSYDRVAGRARRGAASAARSLRGREAPEAS